MMVKWLKTSAHKLYYRSPIFFQHVMTSVYGFKLRKERYNDHYKKTFHRLVDGAIDHEKQLLLFMQHLKQNVPYYKHIHIDETRPFDSFRQLPHTNKSDLRNELDRRSHKDGVLRVSRTSGTTGKNLIVYNSEFDRAERMAYLDYLKYKNGVLPFSKRASFTGQELTPQSHGNVLWRYNAPMNQMLYATYYINMNNIKNVYRSLAHFRPVSLDGYPSAIHMVAKYILSKDLTIDWEVKAVFPNAETLLPQAREDIEKAFNTKVIDQYASAEGAPFIYSDKNGRYYVGHETGLIEFEKNNHGTYEMVVTSFINYATPIVRYRIGDQVEIDSDQSYLNSYTDDVVIKKIIGRQSDYLLGEQDNRVNSVNMAWVVDGLEESIIQIQFIQKSRTRFEVNMVVEKDFCEADEKLLKKRMHRRLGKNNRYDFIYRDAIKKERSGKVRFIINEMSDRSHIEK
ncbi:hypothetical protein ACFOU0_10935 [Salinicoccus sesuvii]|uniref:Phenylacetate-CoA ligase n=1 Tax=Salinicoccus sesuvii TaxID=868281 RepID=A0ABV7N963_9STAP